MAFFKNRQIISLQVRVEMKIPRGQQDMTGERWRHSVSKDVFRS